MDYGSFESKKVVAYFSRNRNIYCVHGVLKEAGEQMTFENANLNILGNGENYLEEGYTKDYEFEEEENEFLLVRFRESDLVGICKTRENK